MPIEVRVIDGTPIVTTTDVRNSLSTILNKMLKKYPSIVIEQKGVPVATINVIDKDSFIKTEKF